MARSVRDWVVVAVVVLTPSVVHAEGGTAGPCQTTTIIGADGPLPRNLPGLPFRPSWLTSQPKFELMDDLGTAVPTTVAPAIAWRYDSRPPANPQPLSFIALGFVPPVGHYVLKYEEGCGPDGRPMVPPAAVQVSVNLGPEQPLPTSLGTVNVKAQPRIFEGPPSATGCVKIDDGQTLTLEWIPSPELTPFLPLTFTAIYWNRKDPGSFESAIAHDATVDQICDPARGFDYYGLLDRYISVTLRGYVAGMDHELDPITVALDLPCASAMPGPRFTGNCDGGADVVQTDASISDGGSDATVDGDASEAGPSASDTDSPGSEQGGCAVASLSRRTRSSNTALLMLALGMVIWRARSSPRRRPERSPL